MKKKQLCREVPYKDAEYFPWNEETQKRFNLDSADIGVLEMGEVYFDANNIAYSLEEVEEEEPE